MAFASISFPRPTCVRSSSSNSHPSDSPQTILLRRPSSSYCRKRRSFALSISASSSSSNSGSTSSTPAIQTDSRTTVLPIPRRHAAESIPQELTVYEFNEGDRDSPRLLPFSKLGFDLKRFKFFGGLGMIVPFTNKLYSGSLTKRLGTTAGYCFVMRYDEKAGGSIFEASYSFYFGDLGHISVQGPYKDYEDTVLAVTGGTGVFLGVYGTVTLTNVKYPTSLFYRFQLYGIPELPPELRWETVPPTQGVQPLPGANDAGVALPNFTD